MRHQGVVKSKQLTRDHVFWPGMQSQLEDVIARCAICQQFHKKQHKEPLQNHNIPCEPYNKIGIDIFHVQQQNFLLAVDYYTKYPEVIKLNSLTSREVIEALKEIFCRHGIPKTVMSDNGPQFSSREYRDFAFDYGFNPVFSSPQYPQSNGQVERFVQTIKIMMKKAILENTDYHLMLLNYRNSPIMDMNASPAQMLMSRRLRSKLPITNKQLKPQIRYITKAQIAIKQQKQKRQYDKHAGSAHKKLEKGDNVRYLTHSDKWASGQIVQTNIGKERSYKIQDQDKTIRRNRKHIFKIREPKTGTDRQVQPNINNTTTKVTRVGRVVKPVTRFGYN